MNHVAQRANSILQKLSPIQAHIDCDPPIQACIDLGGEQVHFLKMISLYCVIKWRHNIKIWTDLESAHKELSYEVLHNMVSLISRFDLGVHHFPTKYLPWSSKLIDS
jgi:hypothetical protein